MLEAFLKALLPEEVAVESAGTYEGCDPAVLTNSPSVNAMREGYGLDISGHRSRWVNDVNLDRFDLVVCMSRAEASYIIAQNFPGLVMVANAKNGGVPNPWKMGPEVYAECAKVLESVAHEVVELWFD
jgi:protein-tyrosine-phosphatase